MRKINLIEISRTQEDTDTHIELALHIDTDFCGTFVIPAETLDDFIKSLEEGFGDRLSYWERSLKA